MWCGSGSSSGSSSRRVGVRSVVGRDGRCGSSRVSGCSVMCDPSDTGGRGWSETEGERGKRDWGLGTTGRGGQGE